jgi:Ca2+-transporting ATPase
VSPENKQKIVENHQAHNRVVAMTGDGVNDALALNMADAGIAMGIQGTDVAKDSSDMVLSDDSFNSIVEGIRRGRGIFTNIRSVVFFFVCINLFEGIVQFILAVILGLPYFLDELFYMQWIFLSVTLHLFPSLILTFDTVSSDVMKHNPRDSEEILSKRILLLMVIYGALLAISMFLTYFIVHSWNYPIFEQNYDFGNLNHLYLYTDVDMGVRRKGKTLTMLMATLYFCECALALQIRRPNKSLMKSLQEDSNRFMYIVLGILFGVFLSLMYIPGFQVWLAELGLNFQFMRLTIEDWLVCFGISCICIISFEFVKYWARKKEIFF